MQAADFRDDAKAFAALCRLVSHQLFAQYIDSGERVLDTEFAKVCHLPAPCFFNEQIPVSLLQRPNASVSVFMSVL